MKNFKILFILFLLWGLFILISNSDSQNIFAQQDKVDKEVINKLKKQPQAPVIVLLYDDEVKGKGKLKSKEKLEKDKEINKQKEDEVLSQLASADFDLEYKYHNIPAFAGLTSQSGIDKLEKITAVKNIEDDKIFYQILDASNPIIDADTARSTYGIDGSGQTVCVLDSGVDYNHVDLGGGGYPNSKVLGGFDFVNSVDNNNDGDYDDPGDIKDIDPMEDQSHGTHVTGIVASTNATYSGIAPGSGIAAVKVLNASGSATASDIAAGIDWCTDYVDTFNIVAMNISIGDNTSHNDPATECDPNAIEQSISAAKAAGIAVFAASGNNNFSSGINRPACATDAISVGATYDAAVSTSWSSCGTEVGAVDKVACATNSHQILDLMAPGAKILSTRPNALGGGQMNKWGTSMSSPMAAGAAALMTEENSSLTPEQIRCALRETGVSVTDTKNGLSFPRIDVDDAIAFDPTVGGNTSWTGGYQLYDYLDNSISSGSTVPMGQDLFIKDGLGNIVARVDVDCDANLGVDVSMGQDFGTYKAFVHNLANKSDIGDVSLYIPKSPAHNSVWICPGAQSLTEVNVACANGFALTTSNPDNGTYHLVTADPNYWIVEGIEDTGGFGQQDNGPSVPELPKSNLWKVLIAVLALGLVMGLVLLRKKKDTPKVP